MSTINGETAAGFLVLFLLYQLAEASGQDLLRLPKRPYSTFALFLLVLIAAIFVAFALGAGGLHQSGNIIAYLMNQTMRVQNTFNLKKRIAFGSASGLVLLSLVVFELH
jgi:hypothetical protein